MENKSEQKQTWNKGKSKTKQNKAKQNENNETRNTASPAAACHHHHHHHDQLPPPPRSPLSYDGAKKDSATASTSTSSALNAVVSTLEKRVAILERAQKKRETETG